MCKYSRSQFLKHLKNVFSLKTKMCYLLTYRACIWKQVKSMPMKQPLFRKGRYQQNSCHLLQEGAYNWTPLSERICQLITLILNIVSTRHNEATWTGIITYHWVQRAIQQMFLSHLNLFLLINSSVLPLDEIFAFFDYQVTLREATLFTIRL